jgi:hypothetical protein
VILKIAQAAGQLRVSIPQKSSCAGGLGEALRTRTAETARAGRAVVSSPTGGLGGRTPQESGLSDKTGNNAQL